MCGITGLFVPHTVGFTNEHNNIVILNQFANQLRGSDSTGMVGIFNDGTVESIKEVGPPGRLFNSEKFAPWKTELFKKGQMMFGHGRAATRGETTIDNAHPFTEPKKNGNGHITLIHNGTLAGHQTLKGLSDYEVDSQWLTHCVAEYGPEETFGKVNGPIACVWYDSETRDVNIFRNHERPLFVAQTKSNEYIINSEISVLMWLKYHFHLTYERSDVKEFSAGSLYTMNQKNVKGGWQVAKIPKIVPVSNFDTDSHSHNRRRHIYGYEQEDMYSDDGEYLGDRTTDRLGTFPADSIIKTSRIALLKPTVNEAGRKYMSVDAWLRKDRTYHSDVADIFAGELCRVEFPAGRQRKTVLPHAEYWSENISPYRPYLRSMCLFTPNVVRVSYHSENGSTWHSNHVRGENWMAPCSDDSPLMVAITPPKAGELAAVLKAPPPVIVKEAPVSVDKDVPFCLNETLFRMGKKKQFKTEGDNGKKIDHWAKVSKTHARHFDAYYNNIDGKIQVGDIFELESYNFKAPGVAGIEVRATRWRSPSDKYVDFYFYEKDKPKTWLEANAFISGRVKMIRLATEAEFVRDGSYVKILLVDVAPLKGVNQTTGEKEDDDEESLIILPMRNPNAH